MPETLYTMSLTPRTKSKFGFIKFWQDTDAHAIAMAQAIQTLRHPNTGWNVNQPADLPNATVDDAGNGFRLCMEFTVPAVNKRVKICIEHVSETVNIKTLADILIANCADENDNALGALVEAKLDSRIYL